MLLAGVVKEAENHLTQAFVGRLIPVRRFCL